jgi:hypothetical protein
MEDCARSDISSVPFGKFLAQPFRARHRHLSQTVRSVRPGCALRPRLTGSSPPIWRGRRMSHFRRPLSFRSGLEREAAAQGAHVDAPATGVFDAVSLGCKRRKRPRWPLSVPLRFDQLGRMVSPRHGFPPKGPGRPERLADSMRESVWEDDARTARLGMRGRAPRRGRDSETWLDLRLTTMLAARGGRGGGRAERSSK